MSDRETKPKFYDYVNRYYGLQVKRGLRVTSKDGKHSGVVVNKQGSTCYVHVRQDGKSFSTPFHPLDLNYETEPQS